MQDAKDCRNCGTVAHLNFCPQCGQETRVHVPSASEFIHEFVTHYVALEGKLWRTLKLLLLKPGALTREYIEGRRASYVIPLRIFLTFSILFFATLKFGGYEIANLGTERAEAELAVPADTAPAATPAGSGSEAAPVTGRDTKALETDDLREMSSLVGPTVAKRFDRFNDLSPEEKSRVISMGFFSYAPYAMLLLMPVFALYLKLLYLGTGRRYGEHFLFALHTNAFAYLQITLILLSPWGLLNFVFVMWLLFYLPIAMRRVYGGSRLATFLRWGVLAMLHLLSLSVAVLAALVLPILS